MGAAVTSSGRIACGVAGWSYPDWRDTVYRLPRPAPVQPLLFAVDPAPAPVSAAAGYPPEPLAFLARYVDMVEVNSSFYRIPSARSTATWARQTAAVPA